MSKVQHTPGPWKRVWRKDYHHRPPFYQIQHGDSGEIVCETDNDGVKQSQDALLIAAAPDLYEKLEKVHSWLITLADQAAGQAESYSRFESLAEAARRDAKNFQRTADDIQTVLAKARGEDAGEGGAG